MEREFVPLFINTLCDTDTITEKRIEQEIKRDKNVCENFSMC